MKELFQFKASKNIKKRHTGTIKKTGVKLNPTEAGILKYLVEHPEEPALKQTVALSFRDDWNYFISRSFDVSLCSLRKKLKPLGISIERHSDNHIWIISPEEKITGTPPQNNVEPTNQKTTIV